MFELRAWAVLGLTWMVFQAGAQARVVPLAVNAEEVVLTNTGSPTPALSRAIFDRALPDRLVRTGAELGPRVFELFKSRCAECHRPGGIGEDGIKDILDRDQLVAAGDVIPERADSSPLYRSVKSNRMPQGSQKLTNEEKGLIQAWIQEGALAFVPAPPTNSVDFVTPEQTLKLVTADFAAVRKSSRPFIRYLSMAHLKNTGVSSEELDLHRQAIFKLLNSLSWRRQLSMPQSVGGDGTLWRVDLRDYGFKSELWDELGRGDVMAQVMRQAGGAAYTALQKEMGAGSMPLLRADWFVATAGSPFFYYRFLSLPEQLSTLEKILQVDSQLDFEQGRIVRSGFDNSGVSSNNRVIQRHESVYGAYWKSYDFADSTGKHNVLNFPFGPEAQSTSALNRKVFEFAGGEMIFNLPNGLQGYFLADAKGKRLDEAPIAIVADRLRPERPVVTNGISCISCHQGGIFHKKDQIRPFVEKNASFAQAEKEKVSDLHPLESEFKRVVEQDAERFRKALDAIKVSVSGQEPVYVSERSFVAPLPLSRVMAELGLSVQALEDSEIRRRAQASQTMTDLLQRLSESDSAVPRREFEALSLELAQALWLGGGTIPPPSPGAPGSGPLGMSFVRLEPAIFQMGSPENEEGRSSDERLHEVRLTREFEIQTTHVTQAQYIEIMRVNPSNFQKREHCPESFTKVRGIGACPNHPVEKVSWDDAQNLITKLNATADDGYRYRLPSEAEWEHASRGGAQTAYSFGNDPSPLLQFGWFNDNSKGQTQAVASLKPNAYGLYDMHGNVWQWVQDFAGDYPASSATDPQGPPSGLVRVYRGGGWFNSPQSLRSAVRNGLPPFKSSSDIGFRLLRTR
jgi:formylglycine-generating enzyme required for sulfatase activity/mono/diheme cytochrome c family protein